MSTGLAWSEGTASGALYRKMLQLMDQTGGLDVILGFKDIKVSSDPETAYLYSSLDSELLGRVLAAAVKKMWRRTSRKKFGSRWALNLMLFGTRTVKTWNGLVAVLARPHVISLASGDAGESRPMEWKADYSR